MPVRFQDIILAYDYVTTTSVVAETQAILCKRTAKIYMRSDFPDFEEFNDELPEGFEDDENYLAIPDQRELDLGTPLALDFAREYLPGHFEEVRDIFSRKGAYKKFRAFLIRTRALERWYAFEAKATEQALRDWCELHSIEVEG